MLTTLSKPAPDYATSPVCTTSIDACACSSSMPSSASKSILAIAQLKLVSAGPYLGGAERQQPVRQEVPPDHRRHRPQQLVWRAAQLHADPARHLLTHR